MQETIKSKAAGNKWYKLKCLKLNVAGDKYFYIISFDNQNHLPHQHKNSLHIFSSIGELNEVYISTWRLRQALVASIPINCCAFCFI
jgi:hypothetical protein